MVKIGLVLWQILGIIGAISLLPIGLCIGIRIEDKEYNKGYCPRCDKKLRYFDTDSQGGRGYICDDCHYSAWVSYKCIDGWK